MATTSITFPQAAKAAACIAASLSFVPVQAVAGTSIHVVARADFPGMRQAAVWMAVRRKLSNWKKLQVDWDRDGALPPSSMVVEAASEFATTMERAGISMPDCNIATDGEISFEWVKEEAFASASFTDDGHFIAFARQDGRDDALKIDQPYDRAAVQAFLARIESFA